MLAALIPNGSALHKVCVSPGSGFGKAGSVKTKQNKTPRCGEALGGLGGPHPPLTPQLIFRLGLQPCLCVSLSRTVWLSREISDFIFSDTLS